MPLTAADRFILLCAQHGLQVPVKEYGFHPKRKWRFDLAWPDLWVFDGPLALEIEGGAFTGGRHTRGAGFVKDLAKYNEAVRLGWRVLRVLPNQLETPETLALVRACLER